MGGDEVQDLVTGLIRRITVYVVVARDSQSLGWGDRHRFRSPRSGGCDSHHGQIEEEVVDVCDQAGRE